MSDFVIEELDTTKTLADSKTCLEFLLLSFCQNFEFKPKQAAGLLTQGGKYLAYIVAKGIKGSHTAIVAWLQAVYSQVKLVATLIEEEEGQGSVVLMLSAFKSGFVSKHLETAIWTCRLYARLAVELAERELLPEAWDWFVSEGGGLEGSLLSSKRYGPEIKAQAASVMTQFARGHFLELFSLQLRRLLPEAIQYITIMHEFLPAFCEAKAAKDELVNSGSVDYWLRHATKEAESHASPDVRWAAMNFLSDLWVYLPHIVESSEEQATTVLTLLKRGCRDKAKAMRFACFGKLFHLLAYFTQDRNSYAPVVYKTLTFSVVESYEDEGAREFILSNFSVLFNTVESVPVTILLEPLIKQLQVTPNLGLSVTDFEFFMVVARHPRLHLKHAIQLIDILGKVYANELEYSTVAALPFMMIARRFAETEGLQEYLFRFSQYATRLMFNLASKRYSSEALTDLRNQETMTKEKFEVLQRNAMTDILRRIAQLSIGTLNERILPELTKTGNSIKRMNGSHDQNILAVLKVFGDPIALLEKHAEKTGDKIEEKTPGKSGEKTLDRTDRRQKGGTNSAKARKKVSEALELNRLAAPRGRVLEDINKVRQQRLGLAEQTLAKVEEEQKALEKRKRVLKQQLEKRRIELGVKVRTNRERPNSSREGVTTLSIDPSEREGVDVVLKRYSRALRLLFRKYASTGYANKDAGTFDKFERGNTAISASEFYKLLKEQGVTSDMFSVDESTKLMRDLAHSLKKPQVRLTFAEFTELLAHTAAAIYSKPANDLSHLPVAVTLKTLLEHFQTHGILPKTAFELTDAGQGDRDIVERLNAQLQEDPNTELPEGYKRVVVKDLLVTYSVPQLFQLSEAQQVALEVFDGLLYKLFRVHILEPELQYTTEYRATGVLTKAQVVVDKSNAVSAKFHLAESGMTYHKARYKPPVPAELNLSPALKYELARLNGKFPVDSLIECAKTLEDIMFSIDTGTPAKRQNSEKAKSFNRVTIKKEEDKEQAKLDSEQRELKRKLRKQVVEEKLKKELAERQEQERLREETQKEEEAKQRRKAQLAKERRDRERLQKEEQLAQWKAQREQVLKAAKDKQRYEEAAAAEEKRQAVSTFLRKERKKIDSVFKTSRNKSEQRLESKESLTLPKIRGASKVDVTPLRSSRPPIDRSPRKAKR